MLELSKTIVSEWEKFILSIDSVTESQEEVLYPDSFEFFYLRYDDTTDTFFWSGNIPFTGTRNFLISNINNWVSHADDALSVVFNTPISISAPLTTYINSQCTIYQNP